MGLILLGIDPGAATGIAAYEGGKLVELLTIEPFQLERFLRERAGAAPSVMFEDSRLETRLWNARQKAAYGAALATARSVGQVDAWCTLIAALCADMGIPAHGVSPTAKGTKVAAPAFGRITGWTKRCNQHERDAAMVAWKFRNSVALKGRTC